VTDFFDDLLRETEEAADESELPKDVGEEITLAEGERWVGRFRREDVDNTYGEPRAIYLLTDREGADCFIRGRTMLENQMKKAAPADGDALAIIRREDGQNNQGQAFFRFIVKARPFPKEPDAELPAGSQLGPDDGPPF
jgi:hypothetical protein